MVAAITAVASQPSVFSHGVSVWNFTPAITLPIFDGGRREAGVQNASAELDAAFASYRERILVAFRDVEDHAHERRRRDHAVEGARATGTGKSIVGAT